MFKRFYDETAGDTRKLGEIYCMTDRQIQYLKKALEAEKRINEIKPKISSQLRPSHKIVLAQVENDKLSEVLNAIEADMKSTENGEKIPTVAKTRRIIKYVLNKPTNQKLWCEFKKITEELMGAISERKERKCEVCHIKNICNKNKDIINRLAQEIRFSGKEEGYIKVMSFDELH